jgi:hypothetical protein
MKRIQNTCAGLVLGYALCFTSLANAEDVLRPEVGKPMIAAQELVKAQKYKEALNKVHDAEAVSGRTPYENYIIERMRATAAAGAGDSETAAKAFESIINSGRLSGAEQLKMIEALAATYYRAKDYGKASVAIQKYMKSGGTNPQMRQLLVQSQYLSGDYATASKENLALIADTEKAGGVPDENMLQLQANCQLKTKDTNGYMQTLERLIKRYPKPEYWTDIIGRTQSKAGFSERSLLDVYRLRYATGILTESSAYVEFAQLALQDGFPAEAKKIIAEGYSKNLLGNGGDNKRHGRLRDLANKSVGDDRTALDKKNRTNEADANVLLNDGYAYVTYGEIEKGIVLMEKGTAKGGLKRPDEAQLHLGLAYLQAGNNAKATSILKAVSRSGNGVGDLAKLWMLQAHLD